MATNTNRLISPETQTPASVYVWLGVLGATVVVFATIIVAILAILIGLVADANLWFAMLIGVIIGMLGGLCSLGYLVPYVTEDVPAYVGRVMVNQWTKTQRVVFQGLNFILPWEAPARDIDLQAEIKEVVGKEGNTETYPTKDGRIMAKYTYTIGPDLWNTNEIEPGTSVLQWSSFKLDTIEIKGRARFSQAFSDFVKTMSTEDVIKMGKIEIQNTVFPPRAFSEFEKEHGSISEVILEDIDRDPALEKAREIIAKTESVAEAIKALRKSGMTKARAEEFVEYYSFPNVKKIRLTVKGLENLTHFSGLIPTGSFDDEKTDGDNKKKKGEKK